VGGHVAEAAVEQLVLFSVLTVRTEIDGGGSVSSGGGASSQKPSAGDGLRYNMHRVLQMALRAKDGGRRELRALVGCMRVQFRYDRNKTDQTRTAELALHAESCAGFAMASPEQSVDDTDYAVLLQELGRWQEFRGFYAKVRCSLRSGSVLCSGVGDVRGEAARASRHSRR
jgi:hypothetical protein